MYKKVNKKYALNNSYFKNRLPDNPSNPFEVLDYYQEHNELPYTNGEVTENWFYECFVEYQKRAGVINNQFFTPPETSERLVDIVWGYAEESERILDACCGFGMLTKALKNRDYAQIEAFDNDKSMVDACFQLTGVNARRYDFNDTEENFANPYNIIISNPPYEIKELTEFLYFIDEHLNEKGKAVLLLPCSFLDKTRPKRLVQILNEFYIELREPMTEKFARTNTSAEIVVLSK